MSKQKHFANAMDSTKVHQKSAPKAEQKMVAVSDTSSIQESKRVASLHSSHQRLGNLNLHRVQRQSAVNHVGSIQGNSHLGRVIGPIAKTWASSHLVQRRLSSSYEKIKKSLSRGIFDWIITDREARGVARELSALNQEDLMDTIHQMEGDNLLEKFYDNITDRDRATFSDLFERIDEIQSGKQKLPECCKTLLRDIDQTVRASRALKGLLGASPFIGLLGAPSLESVYGLVTNDWDLYANAVNSVDTIRKAEIQKLISLHLLDHDNQPEAEFWTRMLELFDT